MSSTMEQFREAPCETIHSSLSLDFTSQVADKQPGNIAKTTKTSFKSGKRGEYI